MGLHTLQRHVNCQLQKKKKEESKVWAIKWIFLQALNLIRTLEICLKYLKHCDLSN